jgi:type II secretory pathway predicted ATPase ExeA
MFEAFYKLSADPFRLSPDPGFSFQHRTYRKAMTYMLHALRRAEGFVMVTGQPGTGKSTLVTDLVSTLNPDQVAVAKIVSTQLTSNDLLNLLAYSFDLDPEGWSKAKVLVKVEHYLKQQYQLGRRPLLIIDEAQGMDNEALEELRLLTNLLVGNQQLLQVFLVGQEQLRDTVNTPTLEQLRQRLIATTFLEPLDADDTMAYIKHRLQCVNWKGDPLLSTETYPMIQRYSHGIPRRINQICSRLFLHGCIEEKHRLGTADLEIVIGELQQELLLPMDMQSVPETSPWSVEHDEETCEKETYEEETYEEEPLTAPVVLEAAQPPAEILPDTGTTAQQSSSRVSDTRPQMAAVEQADVADTGTATSNNHAGIHRKTRVVVLLLIAILLSVYLNEGDIGQSVPDQHTVALSKVGQQQRVQPASEESEATSVQTRSEMYALDKQTPSDIGNGTGETRDPPVLVVDPAETTPPAFRSTLDGQQQIPAPAMTDEDSVEQGEPDQDTLVGETLAENTEPMEPVEKAVTVTPLSREEKIALLLDYGQLSLEQNRLLTPKDDNAYRYFQQVLELDPGNSQAVYGIEQIVARYTTLAAYALIREDRRRAEVFIARGLRILPHDESLQALRERMNAAQVKNVPDPEPEELFKTFITPSPKPTPNEERDKQTPANEP